MYMKENKKAKPNDDIKYAHFKPYNSKKLVPVGFSCIQTTKELSDKEVFDMVDQAIYEVLGHEGLAEIIKPGYKVVIKVNLIGKHISGRQKIPSFFLLTNVFYLLYL